MTTSLQRAASRAANTQTELHMKTVTITEIQRCLYLILDFSKGKRKKPAIFRGGIHRARATAQVKATRSPPQDDIRRTGSAQRDANRTAAPLPAGSRLPPETPGPNGGPLRNKIQNSTREILFKLRRRGTPKFFPSRHLIITLPQNYGAAPTQLPSPRPIGGPPATLHPDGMTAAKARRAAARRREARSAAGPDQRSALSAQRPSQRPAPPAAGGPDPRPVPGAPHGAAQWPPPAPSGSDKCGGRTEGKKIIVKKKIITTNTHEKNRYQITEWEIKAARGGALCPRRPPPPPPAPSAAPRTCQGVPGAAPRGSGRGLRLPEEQRQPEGAEQPPRSPRRHRSAPRAPQPRSQRRPLLPGGLLLPPARASLPAPRPCASPSGRQADRLQ